MAQSDFFARDTCAFLPDGVRLWRERLDREAQIALLDAVAILLDKAPPYRPRMRNGTPLINLMSNCGPLGWYSDERGYRYIESHPVTGTAWPAMPESLVNLSREIADEIGVAFYAPDACLINLYEKAGRLNLHIDHDEANYAWPIVSISLGADCIFQLGGLARKDPTTRIQLYSGDVLALFGPSRLRFHGVEKILISSQAPDHGLLTRGRRINLTLRRARR